MREGWVDYKFKDVASAVKGKLPKNKNEVGIGIPYLTASYLRSSKPDFWIENLEGAVTAEDGDCLILWDGAGAGDLFSAHRGVVSSTMAVVTTQNSKILREFLTLFISSKADYIKETCRGTTVPHVSPDAIANMDLKIPSLPEQKRIVDLISSVDSYIEALRRQSQSANKSRKAVLRELLTTCGNGWEESTLGDLISHSIGGIWGEEQGSAEVDVPVYRQTEFSDSGILKTPAEAIRSVSKSQLKSRTLQEGDILIQKSAGTPNLPGRVVSVPKLNEEVATFSNFLNLLRPNTDVCNPRLVFLIFWDKHQNGRAFEHQRGTNIKNLDLQSYLLDPVLIPSVPDQKRIVELISTFDDLLVETRHLISLFKNLRSGLLSDLLSGDHEIPSSYDEIIGAS